MNAFAGRLREVVDELKADRKLLLGSVVSLSQADLDFAPTEGISARELLAGLAGSRAALMKALERCARFDMTQAQFPHPVFGKLDAYQWALSVGKHEERRRRQIEKVKALRAGRP